MRILSFDLGRDQAVAIAAVNAHMPSPATLATIAASEVARAAMPDEGDHSARLQDDRRSESLC
jgi:hypothetical protein